MELGSDKIHTFFPEFVSEIKWNHLSDLGGFELRRQEKDCEALRKVPASAGEVSCLATVAGPGAKDCGS